MIKSLEDEAGKLNQTDKLRNKIVDTINRMKNAQDNYNQKLNSGTKEVSGALDGLVSGFDKV